MSEYYVKNKNANVNWQSECDHHPLVEFNFCFLLFTFCTFYTTIKLVSSRLQIIVNNELRIIIHHAVKQLSGRAKDVEFRVL